MNEYRPEIGDVILKNDIPMVVISMTNYEDIGSCGYDRKYLLCKQSFIEKCEGLVTMSDIEKSGEWVTVMGSEFPLMQKAESIAPYEVKKIEVVNFRQKKGKTVVVYE